jgi:hypothetical protein
MRSTADDWHGALLDKLMEATKENEELRKQLAELKLTQPKSTEG